jgi:hypothetical protein
MGRRGAGSRTRCLAGFVLERMKGRVDARKFPAKKTNHCWNVEPACTLTCGFRECHVDKYITLRTSDRLRASKSYSVTVIWYSLSTVINLNPADKFKYLSCSLFCHPQYVNTFRRRTFVRSSSRKPCLPKKRFVKTIPSFNPPMTTHWPPSLSLSHICTPHSDT